MEAILIEGLEPPQNRRRGDGFNAIEFIQKTDPAIERRRAKECLARLDREEAEKNAQGKASQNKPAGN